MNFIRWCIERPVAVAVIAILTVLAGLLSLAGSPIQLTPEVDATYVSVTTYWEGASPTEIESEIIVEQEEKLRGLPGLVKMTSTCEQNTGTIRLEFKLGTDKDDAFREVSDKLRQVPDYPENVDEPVVEAGDAMSRDYIAWIIVRCPDPNYDVRESFDFFDDRVKPFVERTPGVSEVGVLGGRERETQVRVDVQAMATRGVTFGDLIRALRAENVDASGGQAPEGKRDVRLRVVGRYESPEQILDTVVAVGPDGSPVRVRDIGEAEVTLAEPRSIVRSKGDTVMAMNVQREVGSNVLTVMDGVKARLADLNSVGGLLDQESRRLGLSAPIRLEQVYDQTVYIDHSLRLVKENIWQGGLLATLCLLVFLRSFRATMIVAATIPISIIGSFIALYLLGRNINVISLAGMAFAVGMGIDNSIVVLENIYRHRRAGLDAFQAALRGAGEVWFAILVSTLTNIIVFIPVLTVEEEVGQLFRDIALAICASLLISVFAAAMIIPPAAARMLQKGFDDAPKKKRGVRGFLSRMSAPLVSAGGFIQRSYAKLLDLSLGSWLIRLGVVAGLAAVSIIGTVLLMPPATYLPAGNRNLVFGFLIPPPGYNLTKQIELGERIESTLAPYWSAEHGSPAAAALPPVPEVDYATGAVRMVQPPPIDNFFFVAFGDAMFMGAMSTEETNVKPLVPLLQTAAGPDRLPGVFAIPFQAPLFNIGGFGAGNSIDLEISGENLDEVKAAALALMGAGYQRVGQVFQSIRPDPGNFNIFAQEVQIHVDPVRAAQTGVSVADLAVAAQAMGDGVVIGDYRLGSDNIDLRVIERGQADWSAPDMSLSELASAPLASPMGGVIGLGSVGAVRRVDSPQQIKRIEGRRAVTLTFSTGPDVALESAMNVVRNELIEPMRAQGVIPPTVQTSLAGAADKLTQVRETMLGEWTGGAWGIFVSIVTSRLFLALLCCYLLMCAMFESFMHPFVILISVPLAMVGGMLGLRLVRLADPTQQLDTLTMLGFVILIGIVVNNAILIVAQALNFMRGYGETESDKVERLPPRQAIVESARTRLRPIMMSMFTSVLGSLPLIIKPGAGSELYRALGAVLTGGLVVSTVFTLVVAPMLMSMAIDLRMAIGRAIGREWHPAGVKHLESDVGSAIHGREGAPRRVLEPVGAN